RRDGTDSAFRVPCSAGQLRCSTSDSDWWHRAGRISEVGMKRVLLVDSEQTERERVRSRLEMDGYDVVECDTAAQVIDCFREGADAVVLCEPPEDTPPLRLLQELKAINPIPPVIMVSSSPSETLEALKEGAYYVTRPPLTPEEVSILTQRAL